MEIEDFEGLKITKYKYWAIYFDYREKHFLLHESDEDYERITTLYERKIESNGRYELEPIKSYYGPIIQLKYKGKIMVYSQVDRYDFMRKLVFRGLLENKIIERECKKLKMQKEKYQNKVNYYNEKIREINNQLY